ncbi:MAG: hypothetical protein H7263_13030, partial [Candidatus Sericytochromatia bacterium]|nr:hypothetical protein [Candidatus Sericytochromatia bacterium]
ANAPAGTAVAVAPKKSHKLRNAALLVGGALVARHYYKKNKAKKLAIAAGH